ncbi:hypothetical protein GCM10010289_58920 [Streptomyces violascens]|nr:hypothetical protein GCM10010289_58920 [Streptomyces violascens]
MLGGDHLPDGSLGGPGRSRAGELDDQGEVDHTAAPAVTLAPPEEAPSPAAPAAQQSVPEPRVEEPAADKAEALADWTNPDAVIAVIVEPCAPDAVQKIAQGLLDVL